MEIQYLDLLKKHLEEGEHRSDRTGTGTISLFGQQIRTDLRNSFPMLTTKKVPFKSVLSELLWFIEGSSDERRLAEILHGTRDESKKTIWSGNAGADYWKPKAKYPGYLGRVYGVQWRDWKSIELLSSSDNLSHESGAMTYYDAKVRVKSVDQLKNLIETIKTNPTDRRMILTAFNVGELDQMALPPCHMLAQFYVSKKKELSCHLYMRSVDLFLGLPFNIASYALLTHMIAQVTDLGVGELVISMGDSHIYANHVDQVKEQLTRSQFYPPQLSINKHIKDIDKFTMLDFNLENYQSHDTIKGVMAV